MSVDEHPAAIARPAETLCGSPATRGEVATTGELPAHPVLAALVETRWEATEDQWRLIAAGLWDGCTTLQLATATGLDLTPMRTGLTRWAVAATRSGVLQQHEYVSLMNLLFGPMD